MLGAGKTLKYKLFLVLVMGLLFSSCCVGCGVKESPEVAKGEANVVTLCVVPIAGVPKEPITIYGSGFAPGEVIRLELKTEGFTWNLAAKGAMGSHQANEWGAFVFKNTFPRHQGSLAPGVYTLVAYGDKGSIATSPYMILEEETNG